MTRSCNHLAGLPDPDEVTPVVRLLTHHIDALERELAAARVERDQAFARGLELLLDTHETGAPPHVETASLRAVETELFDASEFLRRDGHLRIDDSPPLDVASPRDWGTRSGPTESPLPRREQVAPAAVASHSRAQTGGSNASFIAAARRAAQAASAQAASSDEAHPAPWLKRALREHRPILLGLVSALAFGALQMGIQRFGVVPHAPATAPHADVKGAAIPPSPPAPQRAVAEAAGVPMQDASMPATAALPLETGRQQALAAFPQPFAEITAHELDAASLKKVAPGDATAIYELASRAAEGRGMTRDLALAARLFENAAAQGLAPAQYRVGKLYEKGLGVPRDVIVAKSWYQQAADNGNALAMHQLGVLIAEGAGGKPDHGAALAWFRRAARHGVRDSQFNLGVLLARGLGTAQDLAGSYTWFAIAAAQGDEEAAKKRDDVGARLSPAKLSAAKLAAERWRPEVPEIFANEIQPALGWGEAPQPKRTASAGRV